MELREYQVKIIKEARRILEINRAVYLAMEVRTGKTFCALFTAEGSKKVVFVTKKKAISSIEKDFNDSGLNYELIVINYESVHKIDWTDTDIVVIDEAHSLGKFAKPSGRAVKLKALIVQNNVQKVIYLSGTPTPESYSQMYHQLWVCHWLPLCKEFKNFYAFANAHVNKKQKKVAYGRYANDYSDCRRDEVFKKIGHLFIEFTQAQAGFETEIEEEILYVKMKPTTYTVIDRLRNDLVIGTRVIADSPVKLQSKMHQLFSGTIKFEDGTRTNFDNSKAEFIKEYFKGKKLAMFYFFTAEYSALKDVFGETLCSEISEFDNDPSKHIALQIKSGREGTKLASADVLLFYNIDHSATSYWQGRDRMTTMERKFNKVYWIFSTGGIEDKIYRSVVKKKSYTTYYFKKDYNIKNKQVKLEL